MRRLLAVLLAMIVLSAWSAAALALEQVSGAVEQEASEIERLLRCPVCTGQTVAESHAEKAQEIKQEIRKMLAEGKTRQQVLDYYAGRYGEWILTQPRTPVVWAIPVVILVIGGIVVFSFLRRAGGGGAQGLPPGGALAAADETGAAAGLDPKLREKIQQRLQDFV